MLSDSGLNVYSVSPAARVGFEFDEKRSQRKRITEGEEKDEDNCQAKQLKECAC